MCAPNLDGEGRRDAPASHARPSQLIPTPAVRAGKEFGMTTSEPIAFPLLGRVAPATSPVLSGLVHRAEPDTQGYGKSTRLPTPRSGT
jgi:hypothetical protein